MATVEQIKEAARILDEQDIRQKRRVQIIWNREMTDEQMRLAQGKDFVWPEALPRPRVPHFIGYAYC